MRIAAVRIYERGLATLGVCKSSSFHSHGFAAHLADQKLLPDGKGALAHILLPNLQPVYVCRGDGPLPPGQELQRVEAGPHVALRLEAQRLQCLQRTSRCSDSEARCPLGNCCSKGPLRSLAALCERPKGPPTLGWGADATWLESVVHFKHTVDKNKCQAWTAEATGMCWAASTCTRLLLVNPCNIVQALPSALASVPPCTPCMGSASPTGLSMSTPSCPQIMRSLVTSRSAAGALNCRTLATAFSGRRAGAYRSLQTAIRGLFSGAPFLPFPTAFSPASSPGCASAPPEASCPAGGSNVRAAVKP